MNVFSLNTLPVKLSSRHKKQGRNYFSIHFYNNIMLNFYLRNIERLRFQIQVWDWTKKKYEQTNLKVHLHV